ncbi:MAG: NAD(P)/FAD-dependent oxidoreductase [Ruminococcaceae bacterium]|nr:NAD(P)/FAD-dependent oxidoreductase [Oscillospiraceae bacterium]
MGKKIIVAGLGHGGISAAALLAKAGFDVTVYEKKKEGTLGYDWTDIFAPAALEIAEIGMPDEDKYEYKEDMTFCAPTSTKTLRQHVPKEQLEIKMERKDIYEHLINHALECGVKIVYKCEVEGPIVLGNRVVGIKTEKGDVYGDLVIDACGINSPVRRNLPESFCIEKDVARNEKISIFRAFYDVASEEEVEAKFKVMVFKGGVRGISWVASEDEHTDLLMGRFEDFDMEDVEEFAEYLRKDNPRLGRKIVRGGQFVEIPVRQPLSIMVADGYAAIGDSAFMTVPLIGSGIANSLKASKILANTIINDKNGSFSAETLWNYQTAYYKALGAGLAPFACVKLLLLSLTPEEVDYLFEKDVLTDDTITMGADFTGLSSVKIDPKAMVNQAKQVCSDTELLKKIIACGVRMGKVTAACTMMPKKWNARRVQSWAKVYEYSFK